MVYNRITFFYVTFSDNFVNENENKNDNYALFVNEN